MTVKCHLDLLIEFSKKDEVVVFRTDIVETRVFW